MKKLGRTRRVSHVRRIVFVLTPIMILGINAIAQLVTKGTHTSPVVAKVRICFVSVLVLLANLLIFMIILNQRGVLVPDIDECGDPNLNLCSKNCINTPGNYTCSCPKGYRGDGRQGGEGCIADDDQLLGIKIAMGKYV